MKHLLEQSALLVLLLQNMIECQWLSELDCEEDEVIAKATALFHHLYYQRLLKFLNQQWLSLKTMYFLHQKPHHG